jgi:creatinine amidohydrolase
VNATGILEEMTLEDVVAFEPRVGVIGIGSTEPHGPHLPYSTDSEILASILLPAVRQANARGARALLLPLLPVSLNNNMRAFPYALKFGVATFMQMLADLVDEFARQGVMKVVLVNGHGGNPDVLRAFQRDACKQDGPFLVMVNAYELAAQVSHEVIVHPSDHAGEMETSLMLACKPEFVNCDRFADNAAQPLQVECLTSIPTYFVRPWHLYIPESAGGDCRLATAEKGRALQNAAVEELAQFLQALSDAPWSPTFPY